MAIDVRLPDNCDAPSPPDPRFDGAAWIAQWIAACPGGLSGGEIVITGLPATQTDVLVRYELVSSESQARRLTPDEPAFIVPTAPGFTDVLKSYLGLGIDHILSGADHLLFVFALLLLIRDRWRLVTAITAFTIAHSLTLAAAVLGWIVVPAPPVEAVVALSIMFLASELRKRDETDQRLSERYPWAIAFAFGLLHGLGFASALLEIGLPKGDVPLALFSFNLGVEIGQLMFIAAVIAAGWLMRRALPQIANTTSRIVTASLAYGIGGLSAFWFVSRVALF
jgi:hydrogenase/urease accessory protein HupE